MRKNILFWCFMVLLCKGFAQDNMAMASQNPLRPYELVAPDSRESSTPQESSHNPNSASGNATPTYAGFKIQPFIGNTKYAEFSPIPMDNGLLVTTSRPRGFFTRLTDKKTGRKLYDLYFISNLTGKKAGKGKYLKGKVNTRFHDGPACIDGKQQTLYFTRSSFYGGKLNRSERTGSANLKLFTAQRKGKKWKEIEMLPFNSDEFSCAHPSISVEGDWLYFASDMPGGYGGFDLYRVGRTDSGWGKPENLGGRINTSKNELFPFIHPSGTLFFSSDGHPGLGGLDIFFSERMNGNWEPPSSAGAPVNSESDDFGMSWAGKRPQGYFSSDRSGNDDIYQFRRDFPVEIQVTQAYSGKTLSGAEVVATDLINGAQQTFVTDAEGKAILYGPLNREYKLETTLDYHEPLVTRVSTRGLSPVGQMLHPVVLKREFFLAGEVLAADNGSPLSDTEVRLVKKGKEQRQFADASGNYRWKLEAESDYVVILRKDGYLPVVTSVSTVGATSTEDLRLRNRLLPGGGLLVEGTILDANSRKPLSEMTIRANEEAGGEETQKTQSSEMGRFWMALDTLRNYSLIGSGADYFSARVEIPAKDSGYADTILFVQLEPVRAAEGEMVKLIYYDYNKSDIRIAAKKELNEIAYFLLDNPNAGVELGAHTDCRGGGRYNQRLSQQRAESAVTFIVGKGVEKRKISAKGYGESKLTNHCRDGVKCTEHQHQDNRRCEIKVTDVNADKPESSTETSHGRLKTK